MTGRYETSRKGTDVKERMVAGRPGRWTLFALLLALLVALGATVATVAGTFGGPGFTPEAWRAERGEEDPLENDRGTMVSEVLDLLRPGMSRDEVLALLGPPDSERDGMLVYEIGASPFGVDTEALRVAFGASGRLVAADIEQR
jgi:hypothetical protein